MWVFKRGLVAWFALVVSLHVFAQSRNAGEIRGTVTDSSGARVPNVQIDIRNPLTGVVTHVVAGDTGVYVAPSLEPGTYAVSFAREGFKRYVKTGIVLHVEALTVDAVLQVGGAAQEVVEVKAESELVQAETSDKRATLTAEMINEIPTVGRSWFDLTGLLPGVNPGKGNQDASGQNVGINGQGAFEFNWLIDGGVGMSPVGQNPIGDPYPLDAIGEVNFETNNFSAEYGSGLAVINVITKSGTNKFHGSAFEFVQNDAFQARDFFQPSKAPLRWNEYGGTVGGPIKKDKLFFFFSFQRNPTNTFSPGFWTVPSAAMRQGDFSAPGLSAIYDPDTTTQLADGSWSRSPFPGNKIPQARFDSVAQKIQQYYPNANQPGMYDNYFYTASSPSKVTYYNAKVDYNISAGNRLTGSMLYNDSVSSGKSPTDPIGTEPYIGHIPQVQVSDVWTISPSVVNEFRASVITMDMVWMPADANKGYPDKLGLKNLATDAFPSIYIGGTAGPAQLGQGFYHSHLGFHNFQVSDAATLVKGRHILKFGGEFNKLRDNTSWDDWQPGNFAFTGLFSQDPTNPEASGMGYADFLLGYPENWSVSYSPRTGGRDWNTQAFVQDDFKITPKLTLNLGVRWILQTGWTEVHNRLGTFDPTLTNTVTNTPGSIWFAGQNGRTALQNNKNGFAPRLGFAWAPKSGWSVRGSYGIFDTFWGGNNYTQGLGLGVSGSAERSATDSIHTIFRLQDGPPPLVMPPYPPSSGSYNGQSVSYFPVDTPLTFIQEWHLDVQHQFGNGVLIDAAYVGTRGNHLGFQRNLNQVTPADVAAYGGPGVDMQAYRPFPQYQGIAARYFDGMSIYHSLQLSVKKNLSHGLSILANYTLGKSLDTGGMAGWTGGGVDDGVSGGSGYQNAYDPMSNYGRATTDIRHLWNGSVVYQLPFGQGKPLLNRGGVVNAVLGGWQLSNTWQVHTGRPFTVQWGGPDLSYALAGDWRPDRVCGGSVSNPSIQQWFDPTCFVQPTPGHFGNSGRNILDGPGFANMNASVAKSWKFPLLGEQAALQFKIDAVNVFNHPNFGQPDTAVTAGETHAGVISSDNGSRNLQLGARITF